MASRTAVRKEVRGCLCPPAEIGESVFAVEIDEEEVATESGCVWMLNEEIVGE
jgi:hypothetical protein